MYYIYVIKVNLFLSFTYHYLQFFILINFLSLLYSKIKSLTPDIHAVY